MKGHRDNFHSFTGSRGMRAKLMECEASMWLLDIAPVAFAFDAFSGDKREGSLILSEWLK